jgi:hypothetical protein
VRQFDGDDVQSNVIAVRLPLEAVTGGWLPRGTNVVKTLRNARSAAIPPNVPPVALFP